MTALPSALFCAAEGAHGFSLTPKEAGLTAAIAVIVFLLLATQIADSKRLGANSEPRGSRKRARSSATRERFESRTMRDSRRRPQPERAAARRKPAPRRNVLAALPALSFVVIPAVLFGVLRNNGFRTSEIGTAQSPIVAAESAPESDSAPVEQSGLAISSSSEPETLDSSDLTSDAALTVAVRGELTPGVEMTEPDATDESSASEEISGQENENSGERKVFIPYVAQADQIELVPTAYDGAVSSESASAAYGTPRALSAPVAPLRSGEGAPAEILPLASAESAAGQVASKAYAPLPPVVGPRPFDPELTDPASVVQQNAAEEQPQDYAVQTSALVAAFTPARPFLPVADYASHASRIRSTSFSGTSARPDVRESENAAKSAAPYLECANDEISRSSELVRDSVLMIVTHKKEVVGVRRNFDETGSGFLVQYNDKLYLITNYHVVDGAESRESVEIRLPNSRIVHPVAVHSCPDYDLAALEVDPAELVKARTPKLCAFGDSESLRVGHFVFAVGCPCLLDGSVTVGHIGGVRRNYNDLKNLGITSSNVLAEYLQISAMINPGNSGGPIYNVRGEVVGVVTATLVTNAPTGIAFAIPIDVALRIVKTTIDEGVWRPARLGVELAPVSAEELAVDSFARPAGARVLKVHPSSPAEAAGLKPGDVVLSFNGRKVEDDVHLARLIALADPERNSTIEVSRGSRPVMLRARLEQRASAPKIATVSALVKEQ